MNETSAKKQWQSDMLNQLNAHRRRHGVSSPMSINGRLQNAAQAHSNDQAAMGRMTHTGSDGSSLGQRVTRAGYSWRSVAENVARGQTSVTAVMNAWYNSAGHNRNILSARVHAGFGMRNNFWTQKFANPM